MNDEPPEDFNPLQEPMDSQLLQLERELFSLSPVETPRCLASRLERQLLPACSVAKTLAAPPNVVPFRWRRMVVPAAAAVVVVSVLNRMDGPSGFTPSALAQPGSGLGTSGKTVAPVLEQTTGYVLKSEPVYVSPGNWETSTHHYWIQPDGQTGVRLSLPRRQSSAVIPASFH